MEAGRREVKRKRTEEEEGGREGKGSNFFRKYKHPVENKQDEWRSWTVNEHQG